MKKEKKGFTLVKVLEDCNISNMSLEVGLMLFAFNFHFSSRINCYNMIKLE